MSQSDRMIIKFLRKAAEVCKENEAKAELLRMVRMIEAGQHLMPDGQLGLA